MRHLRQTVALVLALVVAGCSNSTQACNEYRSELAALVVPAGDVLVDRADEFRAYQDGEIELEQLSLALETSAAEMNDLLEDIDGLGEAPPDLAKGVDLIIAGVTQLRDAFELDDGLGLATEPELLAEYGVRTAEGVALIDQGTETLGTCNG